MAVLAEYELVIGLEIHAQLSTETKIFATDSAEYGGLPNTHISVVTLAHPGAMPRLNKRAVEYALRMGLACGSQINPYTIFARKNYFYPDLPKGYQISQDKTPLCRGGQLLIKTAAGEKTIGITRIHLEEDAGKSMHLAGETDTLVDFNRAGTALIEIVSEPDLRSPEEAAAYLSEVRKLVRYLDICDGNMEEGSLRCDVNVSVRKYGEPLGTRAELKNMNSMRNVQRAIQYEYERQVTLLEEGGQIEQETRNFDAVSGQTASMRKKENLNDYRYFPEPDLPPLVLSQAWIEEVQKSLPPLPQALYLRFRGSYGLSEYDALLLSEDKETALYFEALCQLSPHYKAAANWLMGPVRAYLNEEGLPLSACPLSPERLGELIGLIEAGQLSHAAASQKLFPLLIANPQTTALELAQTHNLTQESDAGVLESLIAEVLSAMPDEVEKYRAGKKNILGVFVGEVMKRSAGKADPKRSSQLLIEHLDAKS